MRSLALLAVIAILPASAIAQTRVVSTLVASSELGCIAEIASEPAPSPGARFCACDQAGCRQPAAYLTELALGQGSAELERLAWHIVAALWNATRDDAKMAAALGHLDRTYYRLVWRGVDIDGKTAMYQLLLHAGGRAQPADVLPGIRGPHDPRLVDVLVTDIRVFREAGPAGIVERESPLDTLSSVYVSTRVANPLAQQVPGFVAKTNVLQFWASAMGPGGRRTPAAGEPPKAAVRRGTRFSVYQVALPDKRATLKVTDSVITRLPDVDVVIERAEATAARLARPDASPSPCIVQLVQAYVERLTRAAPQCRLADPITVADTREAARDCQDTLTRALRDATTEARTWKACTTSDGWNEEITAAQLRFKTIVDAVGEGQVVATSQLNNEPRTWVTFGVMAATTVGEPRVADGYVRAKVDGRVFVADPMPRLLTAAIVNLHPWPYQASSDGQSWGERVRTFAGVTITPDFGIAAGIGCGLVRGLTVNAGGSVMWTNTVRADQVGQPIPDGVDKNRPFALETAAAWFFGLSYTFK
jgi:hypothetical protein